MRKKATINVSGLSIKDILNMDYEDINKLSASDLSRLTSRLVSATNKRIRRLEKTEVGQYSPALQSFRERTGQEKLSVKVSGTKAERQGKLQHVFSEAKHFLNLKTSTMTGYKQVLKANIKQIERDTGRSVSGLDVAKLYNTLHKGQEMGLIEGRGTQGSSRAVGMIAELISNNPNESIDEIIADLENWYSGMYEESEESELDFEDWEDIEL